MLDALTYFKVIYREISYGCRKKNYLYKINFKYSSRIDFPGKDDRAKKKSVLKISRG